MRAIVLSSRLKASGFVNEPSRIVVLSGKSGICCQASIGSSGPGRTKTRIDSWASCSKPSTRASRGQAAVGLDKRVSRQEQKIDAALDGDADKTLEGSTRRILHDRSDARRQRVCFTNRLVEANIGGMHKTQRFKRHGRSLPSPDQRGAEV